MSNIQVNGIIILESFEKYMREYNLIHSERLLIKNLYNFMMDNILNNGKIKDLNTIIDEKDALIRAHHKSMDDVKDVLQDNYNNYTHLTSKEVVEKIINDLGMEIEK